MPLQTHIRSPLSSAAPISRLRRARAQEGGTILFFGFLSQAKFRSAHLDPPELIRPRKIEKGEAFVFKRPLSRRLPAQPRRSHISRKRSAPFTRRQRSAHSALGHHSAVCATETTASVSNG